MEDKEELYLIIINKRKTSDDFIELIHKLRNICIYVIKHEYESCYNKSDEIKRNIKNQEVNHYDKTINNIYAMIYKSFYDMVNYYSYNDGGIYTKLIDQYEDLKKYKINHSVNWDFILEISKLIKTINDMNFTLHLYRSYPQAQLQDHKNKNTKETYKFKKYINEPAKKDGK